VNARVRALALTAAASLLVSPARAQEGASAADVMAAAGITGSLRAAYWSSSRTLDDDDNVGTWTTWVKAAPRPWRGFSATAEGWVQAAGGNDRDDARGQLREASVALRAGRLDLRVGRQVIAWGRADGINPTDVLTSSDLRSYVHDDDDRRIGTTAAMASVYVSGLALTGVWLPEFRPHDVPLPVPAGVAVRRDADRWPGDHWAVRADRTGGRVDWSVSLARVRDLSPSLVPGPTARHVRLVHDRTLVIGGDVAATVGRFGVRAEAAYVHTGDDDGRDPFARNPYVLLVAGIDRTWLEHLNVNAQYVRRVVRHHAPLDATASPLMVLNRTLANEGEPTQHGATLRVAHKWLRETLEVEWASVATADPWGYAMRPRLSYAVTDHWTVAGGADVTGGSAASPIGLLRDNSGGFAELRWSF
jgi:hypothetical protein